MPFFGSSSVAIINVGLYVPFIDDCSEIAAGLAFQAENGK